MGVSTKIKGNFREVSKVFQGYFKKVSRNIEGFFKGVFSGPQGYLKEMGIAGKFQICLKEVFGVFQERYFKEISQVFQESHKGDSRKIEGYFNGVLGLMGV